MTERRLFTPRSDPIPGPEAPGLLGPEARLFPPPGEVSFVVWGTPAPKGSVRAIPVRNRPSGAVIVPDNAPRLRDWTRAVSDAVSRVAEQTGASVIPGPVRVSVRFLLPRPKSAPKRRRTWPDRKPDVDKLARAVLDPMRGVVFEDDARVVGLLAEKDYAAQTNDDRPRAEVHVWAVEEVPS